MLGENRGGVIKLLFIEHLECDRPFTRHFTCMIVMNLHSTPVRYIPLVSHLTNEGTGA